VLLSKGVVLSVPVVVWLVGVIHPGAKGPFSAVLAGLPFLLDLVVLRASASKSLSSPASSPPA
jgi:hypothetical protein